MSIKRKVLFVGPVPPPFSGPELSMQQLLASSILNDQFAISFVKTNFRKNNKNKAKIDLYLLAGFFDFFSRFLASVFLKRPNLIYYPVTPTAMGWAGRDCWVLLISWILRIPVLIHLRGSHFELNFQDFPAPLRFAISKLIPRVSGAIVQAEYLKTEFTRFLPESRIFDLYQSVDIDEFPFISSSNAPCFRILTVGHLTKAKGYTDILKAIPIVADAFPSVTFRFAGEMRSGERGVFYNQLTKERIDYEDPYEAEKNLMEMGFSDNYMRLGVISGTQKVSEFSQCDIFLSASYSEGFSRALLEALACGKPVVCTPVGAHREVLSDDNGRMFRPGDYVEMASAIIELLESDRLQSVGRHNREYTVENFSVQAIAKKFAQICEEAMSC